MPKGSKADDDSFRMNPVSLGVLIGAVVTFIMVGAIVDVLWVAIGGLVGGFIGLAVRRFTMRATAFAEAVDLREHASKQELMETARELEIEGRGHMSKDELIQAITDRRLQMKVAEDQAADANPDGGSSGRRRVS